MHRLAIGPAFKIVFESLRSLAVQYFSVTVSLTRVNNALSSILENRLPGIAERSELQTCVQVVVQRICEDCKLPPALILQVRDAVFTRSFRKADGDIVQWTVTATRTVSQSAAKAKAAASAPHARGVQAARTLKLCGTLGPFSHDKQLMSYCYVIVMLLFPYCRRVPCPNCPFQERINCGDGDTDGNLRELQL